MKEIVDGRDITKEFILSRIDQKEIFKKYFQLDEISLDEKYINPFRDDDTFPGCKFYYNNSGILYFNDWGKYHWDCFNIVQILYNCSFKQALIKIYDHFNLIESDVPTINKEIYVNINRIKEQTKKNLKVNLRDWVKQDLDYWNQYYIDNEMLSLYNVYPIQFLWINGNKVYYYKRSDPAYVYFLGNDILKVYFPFRDKNQNRFVQNSTKVLQGSSQLDIKGDICIITKSHKDVMCLKLFGINAVAPMTETIILTKKQYSILRSRFSHLYTLFDRDRTGKLSAKKHRDLYGIPALMFDKEDEKDFSDNLKKYGINYMNDYIQQTKEEII